MGQLWDAPAPQGCNFYPILRYGPTEPASLFKCGKFHISVKSTLWAMRRQSFSQCLVYAFFLAAISPLGRTSYPRSLIKVIAHDSRLGRTFWHLIHGSVAKTAGGVARRSLVRANSNNNTRMYISRRKCEWCLQWQNSACFKMEKRNLYPNTRYKTTFWGDRKIPESSHV